jgi:N-dimethylarginine dimethylaminohydrolase
MSGVDYFDDAQAINPFMTRSEPINRLVAVRELAAIREALEAAGISVHTVAAPPDCQDGVFTANWALVRSDTAIMSRLPNARKAEESYAAAALEALGKTIIHLPPSIQKFSGQGDALACGDILFGGHGYRSDPEALEFAARQLKLELVRLHTKPLVDKKGQPVSNAVSGLPDSFYYDLDLALAVLRPPLGGQKGLIAWCPDAFLPASRALLEAFDKVDKIEVTEEEAMNAFACNLVSTGQTVIMNAGAPSLAAAIESRGLQTVQLASPELAKGGGSIRCTSLSLG